MGDPKRDECPICGKDVPILQLGAMRSHRWARSSAAAAPGRCPGSGLTVEQARQQRDLLLAQGMPSPSNDTVIPAGETQPEVLTPEVVTGPQSASEPTPGTAVERATPRQVEHGEHERTAIEAAADAALAQPGMPGRDELLNLAVTARILCMSAAAPKLVRDNPHLAFHIALVGRDLGISPSAALELIDVLDTRGGLRLALSPQLMNGQLRRLGLGAVRPLKRTMHECVAAAYGPDGELLGETDFTWEDAIIAGLVDERCEPNHHWRSNGGQDRCRCNQGYRTYPKRMLWWRAGGFCADDYFPEAGLGMYTPEALGAAVDEDGRPLDPATVALPEGYEPKAGNGAARGLPQGEDRADGADLWDLQARAFALPPEQKTQLRERREHAQPLRTDAGVIPFFQLTVVGLRVARSLVGGFERAAVRDHPNFDPEAAKAVVLEHCWRVLLNASCWSTEGAAQAPVEPAPAPEDPEPAGDAPAATQAPLDVRHVDLADIRAEVEQLTDPADLIAELESHGIVIDTASASNVPVLRRLLVDAEAKAIGLDVDG